MTDISDQMAHAVESAYDIAGSTLPPLEFEYVNYRGEKSMRSVTPMSVGYRRTPQHPEPTWLLQAWCRDRQASRYFDLDAMLTKANAEELDGLRTQLDAAKEDQTNLETLLRMIEGDASEDVLFLAAEGMRKGFVVNWDGGECRYG